LQEQRKRKDDEHVAKGAELNSKKEELKELDSMIKDKRRNIDQVLLFGLSVR
jgi:hypothetical protein